MDHDAAAGFFTDAQMDWIRGSLERGVTAFGEAVATQLELLQVRIVRLEDMQRPDRRKDELVTSQRKVDDNMYKHPGTDQAPGSTNSLTDQQNPTLGTSKRRT